MSSRVLDRISVATYEDPMIRVYSEDPRTTVIPVSAVVSYLYCPRRCYIQYKLCVKGYPTVNQLKGIIVHRVLSRLFIEESRMAILDDPNAFYRRYLDIGLRIAYEELRAISGCGSSSHSRDWLEKYIERIVYRRAVFLLSSNIRLNRRRRVNIALKNDRLGLRGVLDGVDGCYPVEFKSSGGIAYPHIVQVVLYSIMLEEVERIDVDRAYIYYAETAKLVETQLTQRLRARALTLVENVRSILKDDRIPARRLCSPRYCPVYDVCSSLD